MIMSDIQNSFEEKLASIRTGLMEHYGNSESFFYEFSVAVENEMTDLKPSDQEVFLAIAKANGYVPSVRFENALFDCSEDREPTQ